MRFAVTNFTGGEIAPTLTARYDLAKYKNALRCMENFLPLLHGGAERRQGTRFLADLGAESVLMPFSFNARSGQNFALVFGHKTLRIATATTLLGSESLPTPYDLADVRDISYAQVGDIVYLAHFKYPLHKIMRTGSPPGYSWQIAQVTLNSSLGTPSTPSVSFVPVEDDKTPLNFTLRYKVVAVDASGKQSLGSSAGSTTGKHPSDWVVGNSVNISWSSVSGATEYNIYREEAGYFGFIGVSTSTSFQDNNYQANISDTPREDWQPFANGNNPGVVAFHQQRMALAGTAKSPQTFYMSRTGDFENFRKSRPLQEDDPVEYTIASGSIDAIEWAASFGDLLLGTSGSEFKAGGDGGPISATSISITAQSYWGSYGLPPIIIGNSIMHVQRHGARVRDLFYSLEKDGYAGNDLSVMAPHLFDGHRLVQWGYQQSPGSHVWIVRDDGILLALTYLKEHDIWGWSRHITDGEVQSLISLSGDTEDIVMLVVKRHINGADKYYLERLDSRWTESDGIKEAFFIDCGATYRGNPTKTVYGLGYLEGKTVAVLADGSPVEGLVVKDGGIILPYEASIIHVGLPYTSTLSPMPLEGDFQTGTTLGRRRALGRCSVRLASTVGGKHGTTRDSLYEFPFSPSEWGQPVAMFSGDVDFTAGDGAQETQSSIWLVQDKPLPFGLVGLAINIDMGQD